MTNWIAQHSFRLQLIGGTLLVQAVMLALFFWQESAAAPASELLLHEILRLGLIGGVLTVLLLLPLGNWLTRRLRKLETAADAFAAGHLEQCVAIPGEDEIGRLAKVFNHMATALTTHIESLRHSETRLRYALRGSSDGIWDWDLNDCDYYLSPRWKEMLGYGAEELPNQREVFVEHLHPEDRARVEAAIDSHFQHRGPYDIEYRLRHRDGHYFWCRARGQAVWDSEGRPVRFSGATTDISEQKDNAARIEALLAEEKALLDNALVGIVSVRQRNIVVCNRRFEEMFGFAPEEMIGRTTEALFPSVAVYEEISRATYATLARGETYSFELNLCRKDGSKFWARVSARAIDQQAPEDGCIWVYTDESERKDALDSALEQQAFSDALVSSLPGVFFLADEEEKILRWNTNLEKELGYRRRKFVHLAASELIAAEGHRQWQELVDTTLTTGQPASAEFLLLPEGGEAIPYFLTVTAIEAHERHMLIVVGIDISARRQAEDEVLRLNESLEQRVRDRTAELTAANRELESFSYSVSHDLSSPLRGIDGFARILEEDYQAALDDDGRHYLQRIRAATQRMQRLIDDMLSLARVTRNELAIAELDLSALANRICVELRESEPERKVETLVRPGMEVAGDANLLSVALGNLLRNAWKFTGRHPTARIEFDTQQQNGETVYFVRDDGAGFDMRYAAKLFREFQRMHRQQDFEGSGIGLAIASRIIQRHGGRIWAEGAPGRGATFYFTLPSE